MSNLIKSDAKSLKCYFQSTTTSIDESLVSLRFMKEVDDFMEIRNISQKQLSEDLDYSESFISQLLSGVKKFNSAFINKFEKTYEMKVDFKIQPEDNYISVITGYKPFSQLSITLEKKVDVRNEFIPLTIEKQQF